MLFLLNAAALPDAVPEEGLDLRAFYDANGPYFWSLYALFIAITTSHQLGGHITAGTPIELLSFAPNLFLLVLFVVLIRIRRRALHGAAVVGLLALFLVLWSRMSLGAS